MNFDTAFEKLIGHEGGYNNIAADPGGETKYGVSKRSYPDVDIKALTLAGAQAIYRRDYWDKCRADELPPTVRFSIFDGAVNSGVAQSIKWLQQSVGAVDDGIIGPRTLAAVAAMNPAAVAARYNGNRLMFMASLSTFDTFGRGWARRIAGNLIAGA